MGFLNGYLGPDAGVDYLEDWFDSDGGTPSSANGGGSKARLVSTMAPRPQVPPWRHIDGPQGVLLTEIRRFLNEVQSRDHNWGNEVEVVFAAADTPVRVDTGLGGAARRYKVVRKSAALDVFDAVPPTGVDPTPERGIIWLQASAPGTATLYVY